MINGLVVDTPRVRRVGEDRLDLRAECEFAAGSRIEEGLDPHAVACEPELARSRVPDCEPEHSAQSLEAVDAPLLERVHDRLRVGVICPEPVAAALLELAADLGVVVDLAVEEQPDRPVLVRHRLHRVVGEIDDRQASEPEPNCTVRGDPRLASVRASMVQRLAHASHEVVGCSEVATAKGEDSGNATHGQRW